MNWLKFMFSKKATKIDKIFTVDLTLTKGQLISKCLFGVFTFFQKTNENKSKSSKVEFVRSFFGRNIGLKKSFRICLTFSTLAIFGIPRPLVIQVEISDVIDLRYAYLHGPSMWKLQPSSVLISQAKI